MKVLAAGGAGPLALAVLAVAMASSGGAGASAVSPALAAAPPGLVAVAFQAGRATGINPNVLLAIAKVETNWGQARNAQSDDLVPDDIRASIDTTVLAAGGGARDGLHAVPALHLARRGGRGARRELDETTRG